MLKVEYTIFQHEIFLSSSIIWAVLFLSMLYFCYIFLIEMFWLGASVRYGCSLQPETETKTLSVYSIE